MQALRYVAFTLSEQRYGLPFNSVERVIPVVEITPLPGSPEVVSGVINYHGIVLPAFNIRKRFKIQTREIELTDRLIIVTTSRRSVSFLVDSVIGMIECPEEDVTGAERVLNGLQYIEGVVKTRDGLVLIHDPERFLSEAEQEQLDNALKEKGAG